MARNSINLCQSIESGKVVELNDKSIIVNHNFTNILVSVNDVSKYALQDTIRIYAVQAIEFSPHTYGFNFSNWTQSRNICYKANEADTDKIRGWGLLNWLSQGGFNTDINFINYSRSILFQSNPDVELDLFISMGLIYTLIIKMIKRCFLKQRNTLFETITISFVFLYLAINLAWPVSLLRVLVFYINSKYTKDPLLNFSLNLILLAFINPYGLTQLAYVLPLTFQFSSIFFPLKSRFIQRSCVLFFVLLSFNHRYSLVNILIYPILYVIYRFLILTTLGFMIFPFLSNAYVTIVELVDTLYNYTNQFWIIKGHVNICFFLVLVVIYHGLQKRKHLQIISTITFVVCGVQLFSIPFFYTVTMINVGQGDSFLIQAPFNLSVTLIDTGPSFQYNSLISYLDAQALKRLDHLIVTHDDSDHSGNVESLKDDYSISEIIYKGKDIHDNWMYINSLDFKQSFNNDNDSSLVYYLKIYNKRFLFLGDLSSNAEVQLISEYPKLKVDVLKIAHHGSKTSTSYELLKNIEARIGLISVGTNGYGHPSYEVLQRLDDFYMHIFNSNLEGDIRIILTPILTIILDSRHNFYLF